MTTSIRITGLILSLSLLGFAACRDDDPAPGATGGAGGRGGTGGTGGSAGRGGTGGSAGRGGAGGTAGTGGTAGGGVDAPADMAADMAAADGADGSGDLNVEAGDAPDSAPVEGGVDSSGDLTFGDAGPNAMTFFVSSIGSGVMGGNLGGLAGADAKCEALAAAVGAGGRGWKAFLSAEAGAATPGINAKDRIGAGPWRNQKGQMIAANVAALIATPPAANLMIDERGANIPVDWHEVLTGTRADGTLYAGRTCTSWTAITGLSQAGIATDADPTQRFSSHMSGCSQAALEMDGNQGRIYCFASTP